MFANLPCIFRLFCAICVFFPNCFCGSDESSSYHGDSAEYENSWQTNAIGRDVHAAADGQRVSREAGALYLAAKFAAPKCEKIKVEHCAHIGYNTTRYPNLAGDDSEASAAENFATFEPLIGVKCSEHLKFFLCAVHFPMCTEKVPIAIGPCRPLCESVRDSCINVLKDFGYPWPASLNCSKFPAVNTQDQMCMGGAASEVAAHDADAGEEEISGEEISAERQVVNVINHRPVMNDEVGTPPLFPQMGSQRDVNYADELKKYVLPGHKCLLANTVYVNRTAQCVPFCESSRGYTTWDLTVARSSLLLTSIVSTVLTAICTVGAILAREKRKRNYNNRRQMHSVGWTLAQTNATVPQTNAKTDGDLTHEQNIGQMSHSNSRDEFEKSLMYSTICFLICAALQIFSIYEKNELTCTWYNLRRVFVVAGGTVEHAPCTLLGALLYFFGSAARLWWLLICRRSPPQATSAAVAYRERKRGASFNIHLVAWSIPLALCTLALMARTIQADPLGAVCRVGGANRAFYRVFFLGRDVIFALLASGALFSAACNAPKSREAQKKIFAKKRTPTILLSPFFSAKGFIGALYPLITVALLAVQFHEYFAESASGTPKALTHNGAMEWNVTLVYRLFADSIFGIVIGIIHFLYLAYAYCNRRPETPVGDNGSVYYPPNNDNRILHDNGNGIYYGHARTFSSSSAYQPLQLEMPAPYPPNTASTMHNLIGHNTVTDACKMPSTSTYHSHKQYNTVDAVPTTVTAPTASKAMTNASNAPTFGAVGGAQNCVLGVPPPPPAPPNTSATIQSQRTSASGATASSGSASSALPPPPPPASQMPPPPPSAMPPMAPQRTAIFAAR